jgi:hypothetical protein
MRQPQSAAGQEPLTIEVRGRRLALTSTTTTVVLGAVLLVLVTANTTLNALDHPLTISHIGAGVAAVLSYAGVCIVVVRHQPRNPVGWVLILFTVLTLLTVDAGAYAVFCYRLGHPGLPLAQASVLLVPLWAPAYALVALAILLFPDGRLARRWRWVLWAYAGLVACVMIVIAAPAIAAVAAGHDIQVDSAGNITGPGHLTGWLAHPPRWLAAVILLSIAGIWLSFVAHQVLSWRKATGERRQQLKWLAAGAAITIGLGLIASAAAKPGIVQNLLEVGLIALPVGMGVGILKYRLYEIDRIISRTLAYAIVTGLLIGLYAGLVLVATQVFGFRGPVAVAAATLAAAALFNPLRRRVQRAVDRRFSRARYDAEQTVAAFATRLKEALDLDSVRDDLAGVVQQTLEPAHVAVVTMPQKPNSLGSERGLATPSPDGKGRETSRPPH